MSFLTHGRCRTRIYSPWQINLVSSVRLNLFSGSASALRLGWSDYPNASTVAMSLTFLETVVVPLLRPDRDNRPSEQQALAFNTGLRVPFVFSSFALVD